MKRVIPVIGAIGVVGICFLASLRPATTAPAAAVRQTAEGEVLSLIQYMPVGDIERSEQFYHDALGLESSGGDPRMRFTWYDPVPFLTEMFGVDENVMLRNYTLRIPGTGMGFEPVEWSPPGGEALETRLQDAGAAYVTLYTWSMDRVMERVRASGADVISEDGRPVTVTGPDGPRRVVWIRDLNGFFVQVVQPEPPPAAAGANGAPAASYWLGADAGYTIEDTEETVRFYRDVLGLEVQTSGFMSDRSQLDAFGMPADAEYRMTRVGLAGDSPDIHFLEFRGVDRRVIRPAIDDPNALVLRFRVRGIDALRAKLRAAQTRIVSSSGEPVVNGRSRWLIFRDPNNLYLQFGELPAGAA